METDSDDLISQNYFTYDPLDHEQPSIRLIQVLPDRSPEGLIQCTVRHTTLDDTYVCLSYVWGPPDEGYRIILNRQSQNVRRNLFEFLEIAQNKHHDKWLWIDALCINQSDVVERNHQVQQMGKIFFSAAGVLSWLGSDERIAKHLAYQRKRKSQSDDSGVDDEQAVYDIVNLWAFSAAPYWERAWITQEVALARRVTLLAGREELDPMLLEVQPSDKYPVSVIYLLIGITPYIRDYNLIRLLHRFSTTKCHIKRDRIYSLLDLCQESPNLQVDYRIPDEEVLRQTLAICEGSLCFCSVAIVAESLDLHRYSNLADTSVTKKPFVGIPIQGVEECYDSLACPSCQKSIPTHGVSSGSQEEALILCMKDICIEKGYHILVRTKSKPKDGKNTICNYIAWDHNNQTVHEDQGVVSGTPGTGFDILGISLEAVVKIGSGLFDSFGYCSRFKLRSVSSESYLRFWGDREKRMRLWNL
ncbi:HET-domain-containing protein [Lentithecium fluviatile CBS 122367]|uniref:HET-domain-containing protein n=1 Tax=Lentithecium fluviatile CBS 122367 TaxID=1168545 RepID=A0A6G1J4M5_9PLEO|nr:HET-domain-containing protein [Lentithecium fluviatile CBS 122367]